MHRHTSATVVAALAVAVLAGGCSAAGTPPVGDSTRSRAPATSPQPALDARMPDTPEADTRPPSGGRGAVAGPTTGAGAARPGCASDGSVPVDGLLRSMRTAHHAGFDRVVFEFCGSRVPPHHLAYVDQVRHDPSDRPLPLRGEAFLRVVIRGGTTDIAPIAADPGTAPRYRGPARLTPNHPLVAEVAVAGDFERVLSFGIGVRRPTGLHVTVLTGPARLVIDFPAQAPRTFVWPARSLAEARRLQVAAFEGHQPWWLPGTAESMSIGYAQRVLGWPNPELRRITPTVYQLRRPGTEDRVVLTLTQPVCPGNPRGLWNVADTAR